MGLRLLLDTNIRCDYAKRVQETIDTIVTYGEYVYIPSVVIGELTFGFMKGKRRHFNEKKLQQMINRLEIQTIDVNEYIARVSGGPFSKKFLMSGKTNVSMNVNARVRSHAKRGNDGKRRNMDKTHKTWSSQWLVYYTTY